MGIGQNKIVRIILIIKNSRARAHYLRFATGEILEIGYGYYRIFDLFNNINNRTLNEFYFNFILARSRSIHLLF